jgi:hypothetical protein
MAGRPQRSGRWSLRQVWLVAGVSRKTASAAVSAGHLDPESLTALDVVVLRVAASCFSWRPLGELQPANVTREVPIREVEAVRLIRAAGATLPADAQLIVTGEGARLARTMPDVAKAALEAVGPFISLPVGLWAAEVLSGFTEVAA